MYHHLLKILSLQLPLNSMLMELLHLQRDYPFGLILKMTYHYCLKMKDCRYSIEAFPKQSFKSRYRQYDNHNLFLILALLIVSLEKVLDSYSKFQLVIAHLIMNQALIHRQTKGFSSLIY